MAKYSSLNANTTISGSGTWSDAISTGNIRRYTGTLVQQLIDATSKTDGGFSTDVYGVKHCEGQLVMAADTALSIDGPSGSHSFTPGTSDATLTLVLYDTATDHSISFSAKLSQIDIAGIEFGAEAALPEWTYSFKSQGTVTIVKPA